MTFLINNPMIQSSFVVEKKLFDYSFVCICCQWLSLKISPQWQSALDDWCILASSQWFQQISFIYWQREREQHLPCLWLIRNVQQCCSTTTTTEGVWLQSLTQLLHSGYLVYVHVDHTCRHRVTAVAPNLGRSVSPMFNEKHTASIEKEPAKFQKVLWLLRKFIRVNTRSAIDTFTVRLTDQHKTETFLFLSKQTVDSFILLKLAKVSSLIRDAVCNSCTEGIRVVHVAPRKDVGHPKPSQNLGLKHPEL